uniref:Ig-like domain-containing protein n=1 Tax=Neolamprologus brichardi TaxID=32507 RepID=A0A3Q4GTT8_NEOBR
MRRFTLITAVVFCSRSWISASEFQTVEVQDGDEVTLQCSNISAYPTQTDWFRVVNKTKPSCVSSMYGSDSEASFCHGFGNRNFNMSSNVSFVFLQIKRVDLSDAGLYFCGFYISGHTVISNAVELRIQEEPSGTTNLIIIALGGLTGLLTLVVVILVLKIWKSQKGECLTKYPDFQNMTSDNLNYAALNFQKKTKRSCRPVTQREQEPHVVYAATR